ncbi:MAG: hypothetical protein ACEY26_00465 [Candidatus Hodgkinia cicadicola]
MQIHIQRHLVERKLEKMADAIETCLMSVVSTISGLITAGCLPSPISYVT